MNLRERTLAHVAELEAEFGATVEYRDGGAAPESEARLWLLERRIVAKPIRTRWEYFGVLHEFGHLSLGPVGVPLFEEAAAWLWALRNTVLPPTASVLRGVDGCMTDCVMFRCGFETFEDAQASLPEPMRITYDALYAELAGGWKGTDASPRDGFLGRVASASQAAVAQKQLALLVADALPVGIRAAAVGAVLRGEGGLTQKVALSRHGTQNRCGNEAKRHVRTAQHGAGTAKH